MREVTFLPKQVAGALTEPANVISICSPNEFQKFACEHKRLLRLSFYPNDFGDLKHNIPTEETAKQIIDFVESCEGEDIIVHCGEGRIRSSAVACFIDRDMGYDLDICFPGCNGSVSSRSRNLYMLLRREYASRYPRTPALFSDQGAAQ
ncbi:hypothetical protein RYA05_04265 [Pseudomonas syringae pv. actinidiae]|nr:hypothetical protein [Pseudomonas syringae pv. actinidiae]